MVTNRLVPKSERDQITPEITFHSSSALLIYILLDCSDSRIKNRVNLSIISNKLMLMTLPMCFLSFCLKVNRFSR